MQEFLLDSERSRICCRCCSWVADGTWVPLLREFMFCGGGSDCRRRRCSAGLRLYLSFAWMSSSLNTWLMLRFSFADTSTKPFSHFMITRSLVLSDSTCNPYSRRCNVKRATDRSHSHLRAQLERSRNTWIYNSTFLRPFFFFFLFRPKVARADFGCRVVSYRVQGRLGLVSADFSKLRWENFSFN